MTIRLTAGGIVLNSKGEVCIVNQRYKNFSLPKGGVEPGEDILEAAKREIYEETGITHLKLIKKLGTYSRESAKFDTKKPVSVLKEFHMYLFVTDQMDLKPVDPANPYAKWVHKDEVVSYLFFKKDIAFYMNVRNELDIDTQI